MTKKILIIEDNLNDIKYYSSLFTPEREVNLLFLAPNKEFTKEKLVEIMDLFSENLSSKIKNNFIYTKENILEFFKTNQFDFYIIDSLSGFSEQLAAEINLPKEKIAFLSSTTPFREIIQNKGYKAYPKENIEELIRNHLQ